MVIETLKMSCLKKLADTDQFLQHYDKFKKDKFIFIIVYDNILILLCWYLIINSSSISCLGSDASISKTSLFQ